MAKTKDQETLDIPPTEGDTKRPRRPYGRKPRCRVTRYGVTTYNDHHRNTQVVNRAERGELVDHCRCHDCGASWKIHVSKRDDPNEYQQEIEAT